MSSAISGLNNPVSNTANDANAFAELSSEEFISIMVEELTSQDPLEPNDSAAILDQISSISSIESQAKLEQSLTTLVDQNSVVQATSLLGQQVSGLTTGNNEAAGKVTSVKLVDGEPILVLDSGAELPFDRVTGMDYAESTDTLVIQQLLSNLALLDSSMLVGQYVRGTDVGGVGTEGLVSEVVFENDGGIGLELDNGRLVPIENVTGYGKPKDD
ncbi:MAG: flagellar hook capping FlgD N-terminal domain-containing protein [Planctomycetota bacterium]